LRRACISTKQQLKKGKIFSIEEREVKKRSAHIEIPLRRIKREGVGEKKKEQRFWMGEDYKRGSTPGAEKKKKKKLSQGRVEGNAQKFLTV